MKLLLIFTMAACFHASAYTYSQTISLSLKDAKLENVFALIEKQSNWLFVYTREELQNTRRISIDVKNVPLQTVMDICTAGQPITYVVKESYIIIKKKETTNPVTPTGETRVKALRGRIINEDGEAVVGATVAIKGTNIATASDANGEWELSYDGVVSGLLISSIGYETKETAIKGDQFLKIVLEKSVNSLDDMLVIAYGSTTKRLNTGNVSKVTAKEISIQPVSNVLLALEGRVPGLIITQSSGYAGGAVGIQLRGQNSLIQGSEPLFVVDGVPIAMQNNSLNQITNAASTFGTNPAPGGISPFYLINPNDIESVEVLKDADATAIYGSRGANGVILITTKKGVAGKTRLAANIYTGWGKVTRTMALLNTEQYLMMRKEAFANDRITPNNTNAADLLLWDSARYTDFKDLLIGGTAVINDANVSLSGGSANTNFFINGSFHRESTVLPTDLADYRGTFHSSLHHSSANKKLKIQLSSSYSYTKNNLPVSEATIYISRPPNMKLYDSTGNLNWQEGGVTFRSLGMGAYANPLALFNTKYTGNFQYLNSSLVIDYSILPVISLKANLGYNSSVSEETRMIPSSALDPFDVQMPSSSFANGTNKTWIIEPQVEYKQDLKPGQVNLIIGTAFQKRSGVNNTMSGSNYTNDLLLSSVSAAGTISANNTSHEYKYNAVFGRLNFNRDNKYILNTAIRRDGSSRFGPEKQFNTFWSAGVAWIFSNEKFMKRSLSWFSYGKLRGSYGTSGNDQIGDYQFLDTWTTTGSTYQGVSGLIPSGLYNPGLAWETNKKFEVALESGFLKDRLQFSVSYFRNRSGNQLVSYNLPIQTGFPNVRRNLDALIENKGVEITFQSRNIIENDFKWTSQINLTIFRNKLISFPNLSLSSYANTYVIGEPLSVQKLYRSTGVDPNTGMYTFLDVDGNGILNRSDRTVYKSVQPEFYGGFNNLLSFKRIELSFLIQFVKQPGFNYLNTLTNYTPGYKVRNQPSVVLRRWERPGDISAIQRFTTIESGALNQSNNLNTSDAVYSDASYARLKNLSVSYRLPTVILKEIKAESLEVYMHAQNLFTITNYVGADPENQNMYRMPPLRTIAAGIKLIF